jgi:hypothetical protein
MLKKFQMEYNKPMGTPMVTGCKLSLEDDSPKVDQMMYRSMVGSFLYSTTTRPNIMQVVGLVGRFRYAPKEPHLKEVKRIFRYLQGTLELGLLYPKDKDFNLTAYTDADWAGSIDDRKSTSGGEFFLVKCLVGWSSKKQTSTSLSIVEAEYIVVASYCTQVLWMKQTLEDLQIRYNNPIIINHDNTSAISISKNPFMHSKTKHIPIKYHFLRDQVTQKIVKIVYLDTKEQIANIFTKPLPRSTFENHRHKLGVIQKPIKNHKIVSEGAHGQGEHCHRGGEERSPLPLLLKGEEIDKGRNLKRKKVAINAKGGECWAWCYGVGIDVKKGQNDQC